MIALAALALAACTPDPAHDVVLLLTAAPHACDWDLFDPAASAHVRRLVRTRGECPETIIFDEQLHRAYYLADDNTIDLVDFTRRPASLQAHFAPMPEGADRMFLSIPNTPERRLRVAWRHDFDPEERRPQDAGWLYLGHHIVMAADEPGDPAAVVVVERDGEKWKTIAVEPSRHTVWADEIGEVPASANAYSAYTWRERLLAYDCHRGSCWNTATPAAAEPLVEQIRQRDYSEQDGAGWLGLGNGAGLLFATLTFDSVHATRPIYLCRDGCASRRLLTARGANSSALDWRTLASSRQIAISTRGGYAIVSPELLPGEVEVVDACGQILVHRHNAIAAWVSPALEP
jgi:hypothetical protein